MRIDLSKESKYRVWALTVAGTLFCIFVPLYIDSFNFPGMTQAELVKAIAIDVLVPAALAFPLIYYFTSKLRQLAIAHRKLTVYASTDSLTNVMNRGAFSTLVEAYLTEVRASEERQRGAFLIIDADHFKTINDSFGHHSGDQALVRIASTIKSMLRSPDIVGRMGGEEFGVFLPGASASQAEHVAERIRRSISEIDFEPTGAAHQLSVSVGGAVFDRQMSFDELFSFADEQLYKAKASGRNRVILKAIGPQSPSLVPA